MPRRKSDDSRPWERDSLDEGAMSFVLDIAKSTFAKAKDVSTNLVARSKPWSEFADRKSFTKPESFSNAVGRVRKNVAYFGVNYLLLMLIVLVLFLIAKPSSIIWLLVLSSMWLYGKS